MKNKIQLLQFVAILIFSFGSYAQVTVSASNLQYTNNGQSTITLANCGNIDLASSTTTSINLGINLSKPNGQVVGLSDLRVYTKKSSSDSRIERSWSQILESSWNTQVNPNTRSTSASFSINSSDFNASGGTLYVVFKSSGNIEYTSTCIFTISKALIPSFTLSPTSLILACGDTAARTFTVSAANIPNGVIPSYGWGYTGWNFISGTSNSITLSPVSGASLPANVMVFPTVNGVAYPLKTSTVSRAQFTSTAAISGADAICTLGTSTTYTINADAGNTVNWSLSDPAKATISSQNNSQATVTAVTNGLVNLVATITNPCGESITLIKPITSGITSTFTETKRGLCNSPTWRITSTNTLQPVSQWKITYNGITEWRAGATLFLETEYFNLLEGESVTVTYQAQISCGLTPQKQITIRKPTIPECKGFPIGKVAPTKSNVYPNTSNDLITIESASAKVNKEKFSLIDVYPNPVKDKIFINLKDFNNNKSQAEETLIEIFDIQGKKVKNVTEISNNFSINIQDLNKGIYLLKIQIKDTLETHKIMVE